MHILYSVFAFFVVASVWIGYSWSNFGMIWASEGVLYPLTSVTTYHFDFYPAGTSLPRAWDYPLDWVKLLLSQWKDGAKNLVVLRYAWPVVLCVGLVTYRKSRPRIEGSYHHFLMIPIFIHFFTIVRHGYYQPRYLLPELLFVSIYLGRLVYSKTVLSQNVGVRTLLPLTASVSALSLLFVIFMGPNKISSSSLNHIRGDQLSNHETDLQRRLSEFGVPKDGTECVLVLTTKDVYPQRFAAISRIRTCYSPSNANDFILKSFIEEWPIVYVYDPDKKTQNLLFTRVDLQDLGGNLWSVRKRM
jgi:hypothetical protein